MRAGLGPVSQVTSIKSSQQRQKDQESKTTDYASPDSTLAATEATIPVCSPMALGVSQGQLSESQL